MVSLMRLPDWDTHLMAWYRANESRPFTWGEFDCALAAAEAIQVQTGEDLAEELRGGYHDRSGAYALLQGLGYENLSALVTDLLGEPRTSPQLARRGDIVLSKLERGPTLLVCLGEQAVGPGARGLEPVHMDRWKAAWSLTGMPACHK